jgi:hypothetical protein
MKYLLPHALVLGLLAVSLAPAAPSKDKAKAREALKSLQDYIGTWEGTGQDKARPGVRDKIYTEKVNWSWKFKKDDAWLVIDFKGSKLYKKGEVRYLVPRKVYQLTVTTSDDKKVVFEGKLKDEKLDFRHTDPKTKAVDVLKMNLAAEGIRFIYRVEKRKGTISKFVYQLASTKKGETLAKKEKKPECIVSGGVGTMTVSHNGETYYVCCSGCAEEFKANPKKYIAEYKAKKGKK